MLFLLLNLLWVPFVACAEVLPEEISYSPNFSISTLGKGFLRDYTVDFLVPLKTHTHNYRPISLWYGAIQGQYSLNDAWFLSVGAGYRAKGISYPIRGVYCFLDTIKSTRHQLFSSLNTGIECFRKTNRFYMNLYFPVGIKRHIILQNLGSQFELHSAFNHIFYLAEEIKPGMDVGGTWAFSKNASAASFAYYVYHYRVGIGVTVHYTVSDYGKFGVTYLYDTIKKHQILTQLTIMLGGANPRRESSEVYREPTQRHFAQLGLDAAAMIEQSSHHGKQIIKENIQFFAADGSGQACTFEHACKPKYLNQTQAGDTLYLDENIRHDLEGQFTLKKGQSLFSRRMKFSRSSEFGKGAILQGSLALSGDNIVKGIYLQNKASATDKESVGIRLENAANVEIDQVHVGGNSIDTGYATGLQIKGIQSDTCIRNSHIHVIQDNQKTTGILIEDGKAKITESKIKVINDSGTVVGFELIRGQLTLERNDFLIRTNQADQTQGEALIAFEVREAKLLTANHNQFDLKSEGGNLLIGRVMQSEGIDFNNNQFIVHNTQGDAKGLILINSTLKAEQNQFDVTTGKALNMMNLMHLGGVMKITLVDNSFEGIAGESAIGLHIIGGNTSAAASGNQFKLKTSQLKSTLIGMKLPHGNLFNVKDNHFTFSAPSDAVIQTQEPEGQILDESMLNQSVKDNKDNKFVRVQDT